MSEKTSVNVLVCGDRNWTDKKLIEYYLTITIPSMGFKIDNIIEGDANGADRLAGEIAKEQNIPLIVVPADWKSFGTSAGPIRNSAMLQYKPKIVLAFHDDLEKSKETKNMVEKARKYGEAIIMICGHEKKAQPVG